MNKPINEQVIFTHDNVVDQSTVLLKVQPVLQHAGELIENKTPYYHQPLKKNNAQTRVVISNYSISQPTKSDNTSKMVGSNMDISLKFTSDDFSPAKYEEFLNKFQQFLNEKYQ
ncbi:hypothetical protein [Paenibacillus xylanexedens]|uniref:hypothetical protein n=1 Tax=Paenibacillus xylanexedens TaxID=528191 RepID=UPI00119EE21C|nr:hypothetical protein [Paenibacillus xylanexedens]